MDAEWDRPFFEDLMAWESARGRSVDFVTPAKKWPGQQDAVPSRPRSPSSPRDAGTGLARAFFSTAAAVRRDMGYILTTRVSPSSPLLGVIQLVHPPPLLGGAPLGLRLQDHQLTGLNWMLAARFSGSGGAILADEMGLGKTAQALALLVTLQGWALEDAGGGALDAAAAALGARAAGSGGGAPAAAPPAHEAPALGATVEELARLAGAATALGERLRLVAAALAAADATAVAAAAARRGAAAADAESPPRKRAKGPALATISLPPALGVAFVATGVAPPAPMSGLQALPPAVRGSLGPHLIVVPSSTLENWARELARWAPTLRVAVYAGSKEERRGARKSAPGANVVLTSYAVVERRDAREALASALPGGWDVVVFDEAHALRNEGAARWGALLSLPARFRLLLTGTPLQNNLRELCALLRFLARDAFLECERNGALTDAGDDAEGEGAAWTEGGGAGGDKGGDGAEPFLEELQREVEALAAGGGGGGGGGKRARGAPRASVAPAADAAAEPTCGDLTPPPPQPVADILAAYVLRRTKKATLTLPPKTRLTVRVEPTARQGGVLRALAAAVRALSRAAPGDSGEGGLLASAVEAAGGGGGSGGGGGGDVCVTFVGELTPCLGGGWGWRERCGAGENRAGTSALSRLLSLLRKAAIHPLMLRTRLSNCSVLALARLVAEAGGGGGGRAGPDPFAPRASGGGGAPAAAAAAAAPRGVDAALAAAHPSPSAEAAALAAAHPSPSAEALLEWAGGDKALAKDAASLLGESDGALYRLAAGYAAREAPGSRAAAAWAPFLAPPGAHADSGKVRALDALVGAARALGSRVLCFSQFTEALDLVEEAVASASAHGGPAAQPAGLAGARFLRIDGSTPVHRRQALIDEFYADTGIHLFLLTTRAGGVGINLVAADTVVIFDSDWNPQMDLQAEDRAHRMGQTKPVTVHRLITRASIEEHMVEVAGGKLDLSSRLLALSTRDGEEG
jgi:SNF2 family DNA or RNA helicase